MTNVEIIVNDGSPVRVVSNQPFEVVMRVFADETSWPNGIEFTNVPYGEDFPDKSLDTVRVDYVKRGDYCDRYVSCTLKRLGE